MTVIVAGDKLIYNGKISLIPHLVKKAMRNLLVLF
jgi:hypothetical protein